MNKVSYPKLHSIKLKNQENVEILDVMTRLDIDANRVLMGAINAGLKEVVIAGEDKDGNRYFASNLASGGQVFWHLEAMKQRLLQD